MPFFVPVLIFVARAAAPYVVRHLIGQGGKRVFLRIAQQRVRNATVGQMTRVGAIAGESTTYVSAGSQYLRTGEVDWGTALAEGALAAGSLGGAVAFAPAVATGWTGREFLRATGQLLPYTTATAGVMTVGRILVTDEDPWTIAGTTMGQVLPIAGGRVAINTLFATGTTVGLQTTKGIVADTARSLTQEIVSRQLFWSRDSGPTAPGGGSMDLSEGFLNEAARYEAGSLDSAWPRCSSCHAAPSGSPRDQQAAMREIEEYLARVAGSPAP